MASFSFTNTHTVTQNLTIAHKKKYTRLFWIYWLIRGRSWISDAPSPLQRRSRLCTACHWACICVGPVSRDQLSTDKSQVSQRNETDTRKKATLNDMEQVGRSVFTLPKGSAVIMDCLGDYSVSLNLKIKLLSTNFLLTEQSYPKAAVDSKSLDRLCATVCVYLSVLPM